MPTFLGTETTAGAAPTGVLVDGYLLATGTALDAAIGRRAADVATIADEVVRCFEVLDTALSGAGMTRADLVKTTCWITDEAHRGEFLTTYREQCVDGVYPARVTMVAGLPGDCRVAIEAFAHRSD